MHSPQQFQALGELDIASLIQSGADAYKSYNAAKKPAAAPVSFQQPAPARDAAPASSPWKTIAIVGGVGAVGLVAIKLMMGRRRRNPGRRRSHARRRSHRRR